MWSQAAETTSECGVSDRISSASANAFHSRPLVIGSLRTDVNTGSEQGAGIQLG